MFCFSKKSLFRFGIISCRHEPQYTEIRKIHNQTEQMHTYIDKPSPLGEQPLDKPGIPVYQMCQLVIFLPYISLDLYV